MKVKDKTTEQLMAELERACQRIAQLEASKTEREQEEAPGESEQVNGDLIELSSDMIFTVDIKGDFLFTNKAFMKHLGYSPEEIKEINGFELVHPEDSEAVREQFSRLVEHKTQETMEYRYRTKHGFYINILNDASPILDSQGNMVAALGIARDTTERKRMEEELTKHRQHLETLVEQRTAELQMANEQLQLELAERKQAEQALRQSEERYRALFDRSLDCVYVHDFEGNFIDANQVALNLLGYDKEEILSLNFASLLSEDQIPQAFDMLQELKETGSQQELTEYMLERKNGEYVCVETKASVIYHGGKPYAIQGVARDITERKQAEEALRQSEERYRTVLDEMEDSYFEVDLSGHITFANEATCRNLRLSRQELMGASYKTFSAEKSIDDVYKAFNEAYRTGKPVKSFSWEIVRGDRSTGFAETTVLPLHNQDGQIIGFRGIGRDITERKQAEEALRQSEERYRTILEGVEDGYFEVDIAGNITFFNEALCRIFGYAAEESMGVSSRTYSVGEDAKRVYQAFNEVYRTGKPMQGFSWEIVRKDGSKRSLETSASPVRNSDGDIIGFRGVSRDITQRRQAEEERRQLEQKAQMASRLATVGEMASGIAHEINNPLTGVIGYAQLLMGRDIPGDIKNDVKLIHDGAQRVAGVVKRLLTFARQHKPQRDYVSINELIETTLAFRTYELETNNIKVSTYFAPELRATIADGAQLQQVFLNLIVNAETEMKLAHGKGKLSIRTEAIDNTIRISFKDNGPGIARENMARLFDPFFTTREVGQGTGLGLSVCHGIIAEHNGQIYAESKRGQGATFIVELPIVTRPRQLGLAEPEVEESQEAAKARILVVDDEPVIRDFLSHVLTDEGHEVETVDNADDALEKVETERYSLILLDIKMPGMSGIELYNHFKKTAQSLARRVVFITGDVMGADTTAFLSRTKALRIDKPFDAEQLKKEINRILAEGA